MTGLQLKNFIEQVYFHLNDLVAQGKLTVEEKVMLGPQIVKSRLDKDAIEI